MKYFKNTADDKLIDKTEDPLWDKIVEIFGSQNGINIHHQAGLEEIANRAREFGRQKEQEEYDRLNKQTPRLEDNSNDTNF